MLNAIRIPLEMMEVITAKNIKTNLHLQSPPSIPSVVNTENGPTCKNLAIPNEAVRIETKYVVKNQDFPPKPP